MWAPALVIYALASGVPYIDIRKTCKTAQSTGVAIDQKAAYDGCIADETEAKQTLVRTWARLSRAYRQSCVDSSMSLSPSYVDLLTCLEMRDGGKFTGGVGPNAVPPPATKGGAAGSSTSPGSSVDTTGLPGSTPGIGTSGVGTSGVGTPGTPGSSGLPDTSGLPSAGVPSTGPAVPGIPALPPPALPPGMGSTNPAPGSTSPPGAGTK